MQFKILYLTFILVLGFFNQAYAQEGNFSQPIPNQYIIEFNDTEEDVVTKAVKLANKHGLHNLNIYNHVLKGAQVIIPPGKEKDLQNDPDVKNLVQDFTISANDKPSEPGNP